METKELIKKYWFVGIIAIALVGFLIVYAAEQAKNQPVYKETKQENGEYIVFTVDDQNVTADEEYDSLFSVAGNEVLLNELSKRVANAEYETTTELLDQAANIAAYILQNNDEDTINNYISQFGYYNGKNDLKQYALDTQKQDQLLKDYFINNYDTTVQPIIDEENPKYISHILVKVAEVEEITDEEGNITHTAKPTEEEKSKLDSVLSALKEKSFEEVAAEFSEDSSASSGGLLGIVTNSNASQYVQEFKDTCLTIKPGEVSEVITTEFGYHIIKCDEADFDSLYSDSTFQQLLGNKNPYAKEIITRNKAYELGFTINNEEFKNYLDNVDKESEAE